jgi:hypothetical protein
VSNIEHSLQLLQVANAQFRRQACGQMLDLLMAKDHKGGWVGCTRVQGKQQGRTSLLARIQNSNELVSSRHGRPFIAFAANTRPVELTKRPLPNNLSTAMPQIPDGHGSVTAYRASTAWERLERLFLDQLYAPDPEES